MITISVDLKERDVNTRNWVDLVQDRDCWIIFVNAALKPQDSLNHGVGS